MAVLVDKPLDIPRFYAGDLHEEGGHEVYICELLGMLSVSRGRNLEERGVKLLKEFFLSLGKPGDVSLDGKLSKETKIRIAEPRGHLKIVLLALLTESVVPVVFQKEALNTLMGLINPKLGQHFDNDLYFRLLKAFILSSQPSDAVLDMLALMINQHSHMRYFTCLNVLKLASDLDFNKGKYRQGNDQQPTISMRSCQTLYHLLSAVASGLHKGCMIWVSEGLNKHMEVEAILLEGLRALMQLPLPVEVHEMMRAFLEDVDSINRVGKPDLSSSLTPCTVQKMVSFNWGLSAATLEHNGQEKLDANEEKVGDEEGGDYEEEEEEGDDEEQGGNEEEGEEEEDEDGAGQDGDEDEDDQEEEDEEEYEEEDEEEDEDEEEEEEDDENEEETEPPKKKKK